MSFRGLQFGPIEKDRRDRAFTVRRYQHLVIRDLGANIEGPESKSKIERGCTVCLGGLVIITCTAGDAALVA